MRKLPAILSMVICLGLLTLASCGPVATPTEVAAVQTDTLMPKATATPTFTPTPTTAATATTAPTRTLAPTPTPTATPSNTLTDTVTPTATQTTTAVPTAKPTAKPAAKATFGYGIQAHMLGSGQAGTVMDKVKDLGFGWVKQHVDWSVAEPSKGQHDFGQLDAIALGAKARGVSVLYDVANAPAWARSGQDLNANGPPNDAQDAAGFFGALAGHFCGSSVKAIQVWGEQNLRYGWGNRDVSPTEYMALLKPSYQAIKEACPSMIVVSGAPTPTGAPAPMAMDDEEYLQGMYAYGLKSYSDAVGASASGYNIPPDVKGGQPACDYVRANNGSFMGPCTALHHAWSFNSTLNDYYGIMKQNGDAKKKIWVTEFGWASGWTGAAGYEYANDNSRSEQAQWTVRAYQLMKQWGFVGAAFLWNLNFGVLSPGSEMAQWSIAGADWVPTETYAALKAMAK